MEMTSKSEMWGPYVKFINKIRQLKSAYNKGQKQKQMKSQQQLLLYPDLFQLAVDLLKQNIDMNELQFEEFEQHQNFKGYVRAIESIGMMLSKVFLEKQNDLKYEMQQCKDKIRALEQKITHQMNLNYDLIQELETIKQEQAFVSEQLDKSEHQIEHGKHSILNEINARQLLAQENQKLKTKNHQLHNQITSLKQIIETLNLQNFQNNKQNKLLHAEINKFRVQKETIQHEKQALFAQKIALQGQIRSLEALIEEKDYILVNKPVRETQPYENFAQIRERFFSSTVRVVRQENEDAGSDKEVMKGIEEAGCVEPILALKFTDSRSASRHSEVSSTSIRIQNLILDDILDSYQESPGHYGDRKLLKTDRKRKESTGPKEPHNKSCNKVQDKCEHNPVSKALFVNASPKIIQKTQRNQITTERKVKEQDSGHKNEISLIRNSSQQNCSNLKNKKFRGNASVILRNTKGKAYDKESNNKKGKIEHSHSVEDLLFRDDTSQIEAIQRQLYNKEKIIENLKLQNRSVRQMVLQESEKRTDAEHEYEQRIQKLQSEVEYFKKQMKENYIKFIQEKALSDSLQNELMLVSDQIQKKRQEYERTKSELKLKCKQYIQEAVAFYQSRYEQIQEKLKAMESDYMIKRNLHEEVSSENEDVQREENPKELKKCKSNSLFYKEVKHHSYNASQDYSEINQLSANHSKNTSFINIQEDELGTEKKRKNSSQNIYIEDYDEHEMQERVQVLEDLNSYRGENELCQIGIQTQAQWSDDDSSYKLSLEYSKMQEAQDSSEISYEFSSLGLRSSEEISSKLKLFMQERAQKIKRFGIYHFETIILESERSYISEFDTNPYSPRAKDVSYMTADHSQLYKMKENSPLGLEKAFAFTIDYPKTKSESGTETQKPEFSIVKSETVSVKSSMRKNNMEVFQNLSESILPKKKSLKNTSAQHEICILESFETQTSLTEVQMIGIQSSPEIEETQTQTAKESLEMNEIFSLCFLPTEKSVKEVSIQTPGKQVKETEMQTPNKQISQTSMQTPCKHMSLESTRSKIQITPTVKKSQTFSTQTKSNPLSIAHTVLNETIFPSERLKFDHNQSLIQEHLNQVISDMSQSFEMSEHFIDTLRKKLLQINQNLRQLQEEKHNDSSSSSSNGVEKIFNSIEMELENTAPQKTLKALVAQSIPQIHHVGLFEGSVQGSKASTNNSVSTSLSFPSPNRPEVQQVKLKVPQFQEIPEIQSENVDSFITKLESKNISIEPSMEPYNCSQYEGSVNRSPELESVLVEELKVQPFIQVREEKFGSGKKVQEGTKKLQNLFGSPKNILFSKSKVTSPVNSPKIKATQGLFKAKSSKLEKPKELDQISQKDFELICLKYKVKRMKLVERKVQKKLNNQSTDVSEDQMYYRMFSREFMVVFCKEMQKKGTLLKENIDIFVVHESRIMSLTQNFEFEAERAILSESGNKTIFGNQEITLSESQLKFSMNNKLTHFYGSFPVQTTLSQMEAIKSKEYQILNMYKYKFK